MEKLPLSLCQLGLDNTPSSSTLLPPLLSTWEYPAFLLQRLMMPWELGHQKKRMCQDEAWMTRIVMTIMAMSIMVELVMVVTMEKAVIGMGMVIVLPVMVAVVTMVAVVMVAVTRL